MITFKLNGKSVQIKTSWDEFDYSQFLQTFQPLDFKGVLAVCARLPYDEAFRITGDIEALVVALNFIKKQPDWTAPVTKCGPYELPINKDKGYDITYASLAQFEDMRAVMGKLTGETQAERAKSIAELYPTFLAIYLQKIRDGEYSYNKAMEMVEEIKTYPAREVVTLGSFFLVKLTSLSNGTPDSSQTTAQNPKKKKQDSVGSNKHSGRSPRSRK